MTTFFYHWNNIPDDFVGRCYCKLQAAYYWIGKNKVYHREDGPAVLYDSGTEIWMKDGMWHRLDGPALSSKDFPNTYWINDKAVSDEDFYNHPLVLKHKLDSILALGESVDLTLL